MKTRSLMFLVFLTLTVAAYNYQFHNVPRSMYLNAYKLSELQGGTDFSVKLPSFGIPHEYRDVTNETGFRNALEYVITSDSIRYPIKVPEYSTAEWWLKHASNFLEYDMTIKFFNNFYFLQVRYYPEFQRTWLEHGILWAINIVTVVAWFYFLFTETPLQKWRMRK